MGTAIALWRPVHACRAGAAKIPQGEDVGTERSLYPLATPELARLREELGTDNLNAWRQFSRQIYTDGALPGKTKQLVALAVAHVTQCPYCIRAHTQQALKSGATPREMMEAIWVAAEMRAGAAVAHSELALDVIREHQKGT